MITKRQPVRSGDHWRVPLSSRRHALVSDDDIDTVRGFNWSLQCPRPGSAYAVTRIAGRLTYMHVLLGFAHGDHINGRGLDNRRSNLRHATRSQNNANQHKRRGCASRYKGVSIRPSTQRGKRFLVLCGPAGTNRYVGTFDDEVEAARAYDAAARRIFGEFARTNFD